MLLRREFFRSIASLAVAAGPAAAIAKSSENFSIFPPSGDLRWRSFLVETLPNNDAYRAPVVTRVGIQTQGELIAIVGDDHTVSVYDHQQQAYLAHIKRHQDWVRDCCFSPDGTKLATAGNDRLLLIWSVGQWEHPIQIRRQNEAIYEVAFSPDGGVLSTVGFCRKLSLYDVASGQLMEELECPCNDMHAVAFSADGSLLAAGGRSGMVRVWSRADLKQISQFKAHNQRIRSLEFTAGNEIISAGDDQIIRITDAQNPSTNRSLPRQAAKLYATALLDDQFLASGGSDNMIHVWHLGTLQRVGSLKGHSGTVSSLAYSRRLLVSGSYDTRVRIWNVEPLGEVEQRTTDRGSGWNPAFK